MTPNLQGTVVATITITVGTVLPEEMEPVTKRRMHSLESWLSRQQTDMENVVTSRFDNVSIVVGMRLDQKEEDK